MVRAEPVVPDENVLAPSVLFDPVFRFEMDPALEPDNAVGPCRRVTSTLPVTFEVRCITCE